MQTIQKQRAGLYFHIPFCKRKCDYCHFYVIPDKKSYHEQLLEGLKLEWTALSHKLSQFSVQTIYFGGGTPALFGPENIAKVLSWIPYDPAKTEITLEANPENITVDLMRQYYEAGINRISIGVQSLHDSQLEMLSRTHSAKKAIDAIHDTRSAGFTNISIDLMYDLPHQSLDTWEKTLDCAVKLPITHLSLYNLTIEPHTAFFKRKMEKDQPSDAISQKMYELAIEKLEQAGFQQYEISAFAKDGHISKHNTGYWLGIPFLGLGPSAFSYWDKERYRNIANLSKYLKTLREEGSPVDFSERLDPNHHRRELLVINLRMLEGVDLGLEKFQPLEKETRDALDLLEREQLIVRSGEKIALTKKGILVYDAIAVELI